jgi:hypothetical protein
VLGERAYQAVNRWVLGQGGRPRFKGKGHGLHSLTGKDLQGALRVSPDGAGLQWGHGFVLPFAFDQRSRYQWWAAWHVGEGRLRSCRIVRTRVNSRWTYAAQLLLDGSPLRRYQAGEGLVGLDVGPSSIAVVTDTGAWKETFCAELDDKAQELRRLQRRLDRQHRAGSPDCFDSRAATGPAAAPGSDPGEPPRPPAGFKSCTGGSPPTAGPCMATSRIASSARAQRSAPRSCPTRGCSAALAAVSAAGRRERSSPCCPARLPVPAGRSR